MQIVFPKAILKKSNNEVVLYEEEQGPLNVS